MQLDELESLNKNKKELKNVMNLQSEYRNGIQQKFAMLLKNKGKPETTEETELLNKKSFGRSIKTMDRNTSAFWKEMK